MAIQPFGINVREKKEKPKKRKLTTNQIVTIILSTALLLVTAISGWQTYTLSNENTNLQKANFGLQNKQTNYPIQAFEYPIEASVEGGYVNRSTYATVSSGFLNATVIISTPDIARLIIENCILTPIYSGKSLTTGFGYLDLSKIGDWSADFGTDSNTRSQWYNYNNFTYYTNQEGINTISVSIPIDVTFYMNPSYDFPSGTILPTWQVPLGNMTVTANITDMQTNNQITNNQIPISFSTELYAYVTIS